MFFWRLSCREKGIIELRKMGGTETKVLFKQFFVRRKFIVKKNKKQITLKKISLVVLFFKKFVLNRICFEKKNYFEKKICGSLKHGSDTRDEMRQIRIWK